MPSYRQCGHKYVSAMLKDQVKKGQIPIRASPRRKQNFCYVLVECIFLLEKKSIPGKGMGPVGRSGAMETRRATSKKNMVEEEER